MTSTTKKPLPKSGDLIKVTPKYLGDRYKSLEQDISNYIVLSEIDLAQIYDENYRVEVFCVKNNRKDALLCRFFVLHPESWEVIE